MTPLAPGCVDFRERLGAVAQQMLERLKIDTQLGRYERDPDTRVDRKPAVRQGEHVGGGRRVEQPLHAEPPDHAAADPLGERGEVALGERPGWQERAQSRERCPGSPIA